MDAADTRLHQLQDELQTLKAEFGKALQLRKAPAGSQGAPFAITLALQVPAPASAAMYDVDTLDITVELSQRVLDMPPQAAAVAVSVSNQAMPGDLRALIAARLHAAWLAAQPAATSSQGDQSAGSVPHNEQPVSPLGLRSIFEAARQQFVALICAVPEHVERYETVDASGATVRRFAIVDTDIHASSAASSSDRQPVGRAAAAATAAAASGTSPSKQQFEPCSRVHSALPASNGITGSSGVDHTTSSTNSGLSETRLSRPSAQPSARPAQYRPQRLPMLPGATRPDAQLSSEQLAANELAALARRFGAALQLHEPVLQLQQEGQKQEVQQAGQQQQQQPQQPQTVQKQQQQQLQRFSLALLPTDPQWGDRGPLHITGALSTSTYPTAASLQLSVTASLPGVPPTLAQALQRALRAHVAASGGQPGLLRAALKHVENYAGEMAQQEQQQQEQKWQQQSEHRRRAEGQASHQGLLDHSNGAGASSSSTAGTWDGFGSSSSSDDDQSGSESGSGSLAGDESDQEGGEMDAAADEVQLHGHGIGASEERADGVSGPPSFAVSLEGLQLDNIAVVEVLKASLQVTCSRCSTPAVLDLASDAVDADAPFQASGECSKCHQQLGLALRPRFIHETANQLGTLRPHNCVPLDLLPSMFAGQCAHCSAVAALRGVQIGLPSERACSGCHKPMGLHVRSVAFIPKGTAAQAGQQKGAGAGRGGRQRGGGGAAGGRFSAVVLEVGQPLPDVGTCKHYRHSHRWLRFPCCGVRFPCDLCHEELTDGHEMRWATRMVCGFCSVEQAVASECSHCGRKLATAARNPTGRNTRFWEGGQGCRDTKHMNRNDPRKHKNKRKTKSTKASRVGPKPWSGAKNQQQGED